MKLKILNTIFIIFITMNSYSQNTEKYLAQARLNNKFGCIDLKGNEIIPIKYDDIGFWGSDLIPVNIGAKEVNYSLKGGKWGYCNSDGKLVIKLQFDKAETFNEGIAPIKIGRKWGFINTKGEIIIKPKYEEVRKFHENLCPVSKNRKWGFINKFGEEIIKLEYGEVDEFNNGIAKVLVGYREYEDFGNSKGKYCLINSKGKKLTEPIFQNIGDFSEGFAKIEVEDSSNGKSKTKFGFINSVGKIVILPIYDDAKNFYDGLAIVGNKNEKVVSYETEYNYGYINNKGEEVIKMEYSKAYPFSNGRAIVCKGKQRRMGFIEIDNKDSSIKNHEDWPKYALINKKGEYILNFDWRNLSEINSNFLIAQRAKFNGDGVIDIKGNTIIPFEYTNLNYLGQNLFNANDGGGNDGEVKVIDINNKLLIQTKKFAMPSPKYEFGMLHVRTNRLTKSGFVDLKGKWIIKDKYDMIWDFQLTK